MTGIEKFEIAIAEFGVKLALEYFATPEEYHHLWDDEWLKHVESIALPQPSPTVPSDTVNR